MNLRNHGQNSYHGQKQPLFPPAVDRIFDFYLLPLLSLSTMSWGQLLRKAHVIGKKQEGPTGRTLKLVSQSGDCIVGPSGSV